MDDTKIVVISSPGSMATRWLAQCFSRVPDVLVLHAKNIVGPMEKDPSEKDFANHDFYHEPLDDWPLFYQTETFPRFLQYLEELRNKRKKKKIIAIHTVPVHGRRLFDIVTENNGKFLMLVREPVQALDSQFSHHQDPVSLAKEITYNKLRAYYSFVEEFLQRSGNFAIGAITNLRKIDIDSNAVSKDSYLKLLFLRYAYELAAHYDHAINSILKQSVSNFKKEKRQVSLLNTELTREFVEDYCGIYRFEDFTTLREQTLVNLFSAVIGENRCIADLRENVFYNVKINVHRKRKKTSEEVFEQWTKAQCLMFSTVFSSYYLFSTEKLLPGFLKKSKNMDIKNRYPTPLDIFFDYKVDGFY